MEVKFKIPIRTRLEKCNTMGDVFKIVSEEYDLFSKPIPLMYKNIIITSVITAIGWINPNAKH